MSSASSCPVCSQEWMLSLIYMCVLEISSSPRHILHLSGVFLLYRIYNFNVISSLVGKNKDSYPSSVSSLLCNLGLLS